MGTTGLNNDFSFLFRTNTLPSIRPSQHNFKKRLSEKDHFLARCPTRNILRGRSHKKRRRHMPRRFRRSICMSSKRHILFIRHNRIWELPLRPGRPKLLHKRLFLQNLDPPFTEQKLNNIFINILIIVFIIIRTANIAILPKIPAISSN